jgi:hypothetical protein
VARAGSAMAMRARQMDPVGSAMAMRARRMDPAGSARAIGARRMDPAGSAGAMGARRMDPAGSAGAMGARRMDPAGSAGAVGARRMDPAGSARVIGARRMDPAGSARVIGARRMGPAGSMWPAVVLRSSRRARSVVVGWAAVQVARRRGQRLPGRATRSGMRASWLEEVHAPRQSSSSKFDNLSDATRFRIARIRHVCPARVAAPGPLRTASQVSSSGRADRVCRRMPAATARAARRRPGR